MIAYSDTPYVKSFAYSQLLDICLGIGSNVSVRAMIVKYNTPLSSAFRYIALLKSFSDLSLDYVILVNSLCSLLHTDHPNGWCISLAKQIVCIACERYIYRMCAI